MREHLFVFNILLDIFFGIYDYVMCINNKHLIHFFPFYTLSETEKLFTFSRRNIVNRSRPSYAN